ncbi:MAG: NADH-quinone oxidoreductase subunit C [Pseudomonadota bacterium]
MSDADIVPIELEDLADRVHAAIEEDVEKVAIEYGELTVCVRPEKIPSVLTFLRDDSFCRFVQLIDLCGVDYPERPLRFDVVYHLLSMHNNKRIRAKVQVGEGDTIPSIRSVFPAADWFEREAFDMYGLIFSGHTDLRRLLTDYGFQGHPLRKDFPLTGYTEVRYDDEKKRVVYEPVNLVQEFRNFDYLSPWEGADYVLPGDEKVEDDGR